MTDDLGAWGVVWNGGWGFDGEHAAEYVLVRLEADGREALFSFETFVSDGVGWDFHAASTRDLDADGRPELLIEFSQIDSPMSMRVFDFVDGRIEPVTPNLPPDVLLSNWLDADQDGLLDVLVLSPEHEIGYSKYATDEQRGQKRWIGFQMAQ